MRGIKTPPEKAEQIKALTAQKDSKSKVSRLLGIPRETIRDIVLKDDEFAEFRHEMHKDYISKTWLNILEIETALAGKIKSCDISELPLREITGALKDLKMTVENVANNININSINVVPILGGLSSEKDENNLKKEYNNVSK